MLKNTIANLFGNFYSIIIGMAFVPIYIKHLGLESYGLVGFIASLQIWFLLLDAGVSATLNRQMSSAHKSSENLSIAMQLFYTFEKLFVLLSVIILIVTILTSKWIASSWLNSGELSNTILVESINVGGAIISIRLIQGIYIAVLNGLQKQVTLNFSKIIFSTIRALSALILLEYFSGNIFEFLLIQLSLLIIETLALKFAINRFIYNPSYVRSFPVENLRTIWKFAVGIGMQSVLATALSQIDKIILSKLVPMAELGAYTFSHLVASGLTIAASSIYAAALPRLTTAYAERDAVQLNDIYKLTVNIIFSLTCPLALMLIFFNTEIISIWSKNMGLAANVSLNVSILSIGFLLNSLVYAALATCIASGQVRRLVAMNGGLLFIFIPSLFLIVPLYGTIGASFMWLFLNVIYVFFGIKYLTSKLSIFINNNFYVTEIMPEGLINFVLCLTVYSFKEHLNKYIITEALVFIIFVALYSNSMFKYRNKILSYIRRRFI